MEIWTGSIGGEEAEGWEAATEAGVGKVVGREEEAEGEGEEGWEEAEEGWEEAEEGRVWRVKE